MAWRGMEQDKLEEDRMRAVAGKVTQSLEPYMLRLYPLLERQKRGDSLAIEEIERTAGVTIDEHPGILQRVARWFDKHRGFRVQRRGPLLYLLTAEEQAVQFPPRDFARSKRRAAATLRRIIAVAPADLAPAEREKQELNASLAQAQLAHAVGAAKESAFILDGKQTKRLGS